MYNCYNFKKFLFLLFCDVVIFCLIFGLFKFNLKAEQEEKGIFLPIIMYHSVLPDTSESTDYIVTPETIENDLKYLQENGYNTILPRDLCYYADYNVPLPENPIMLTFDDGNYNNMYYVLPLLEEYGMKATINVVGEYTDFFSTNGEEHIVKYSYLTWDDIRYLNNTEYVEIGNHTYNLHSNTDRKGCSKFSYETEEEYADLLTEDIGKLQSDLYMNSGVVATSFAYPFGYISEESLPVLKKLGFRITFTCYEKPNYVTANSNSFFSLNRYNRPENISTEEFMEKLLQQPT